MAIDNSIVESCGYRFQFSQIGTELRFDVVRLDSDDTTEEDEKCVRECLNDMGKWEQVTRALSDLITGAGLSSARPDTRRLGPDVYEINVKLDRRRDGIRGSISLSRKQRLLHDRENLGLSVSEVVERLKTVDKWRNLQRAISSLRSN